MASTLAAIALIGGGIQAFGQFQEGQEAERTQKFNAQIAEQEAELTRKASILEEFRARKRLKTFTGKQIAQFAKAGVEFTGSPLDVIADSIANAELDIAIDKFNFETGARRLESEARERRAAGRRAARSATIRATGTLLTSTASFGQKFNVGKTKIGE